MFARLPLSVLAYAAFISLGLPDGLLGPAWPSMAAEFGQGIERLAVVLAVFVSGYLAASFGAGWVMGRWALGPVLAVATGLAAGGLLCMAAAPGFGALAFAAGAAGVAGGVIDAGLNAYGAERFDRRTLNWLHAFWGLGAALGPLVVTAALATGAGWRAAFLLVGLAQAALALAFWRVRGRWAEIGGTGEEARGAPPGETLRRPRVWLGAAVFFAYSGLELGTAQWSYSVMTLARGLPEAVAGTWVALYWASLTGGRLAFGVIADRVESGAALRAATALAILGTVLFWWAPATWTAGLGLVLTGAGLAPVFATMIGETPERVGRAHSATAIGVQIAAAGLGGAVLGGAAIGMAVKILGLGAVGPVLVAGAVGLAIAREGLARRVRARPV